MLADRAEFERQFRELQRMPDNDPSGPGPFETIAEAIAYVVEVMREGGVYDEADVVAVILSDLNLSRDTLREAADVLKLLGYVRVVKTLRLMTRRAKPRPAPKWTGWRVKPSWTQ